MIEGLEPWVTSLIQKNYKDLEILDSKYKKASDLNKKLLKENQQLVKINTELLQKIKQIKKKCGIDDEH